MSDPQQNSVPPYASNAAQPPQAPPPQPGYPSGQAPAPQQYYQGHAQPGYAKPGYAAPQNASDSSGTANAPGRVGFILGLVAVGLQVLLNVIIQVMIRSQGYDVINLVSGVVAVIILLAGVGALVFGLIGLRRAGAPKTFAGIATGLGIAVVVSGGFNFVLNAISSVLYF